MNISVISIIENNNSKLRSSIMFPCPSKSKNVSYMPMVHDESGKNEHAALIF